MPARHPTAGPFAAEALPALRSAAAAVAAAAVAAAGALLCLVDPQRTPAQLLAIEILNGARCVGARHLHESEAARPACVAVGDDAHRLDGAVLREQLADLTLTGRKRQVSDVDLRHAIKLLMRKCLAGGYLAAQSAFRRTHLPSRDACRRSLQSSVHAATWSGTIRLYSDSEAGTQTMRAAGGRKRERSRTGAQDTR